MEGWIRPEFDLPMRRVQRVLADSLARLRSSGPPGEAWQTALAAAQAISAAPRHDVRPQLVLLGFLGGGGDPAAAGAATFAAGVEMFHLFALLHDDVMDHGTLRRGRPTVHRALQAARRVPAGQVSEHLAILVGNLLHVQAMRLLLEGARGMPGESAGVALMLQAAERAGRGQFLDLLGWHGPAEDLSPADFRGVLQDKSGHHSIAAPLAAGWRLADRDGDLADVLAWGAHVGMAFVGLDDLQDVLADPAETGKDRLQDLREGRLSLLSHLLREALPAEEWATLRPLLGRGVMTVETRRHLFHLLAHHRLVPRCQAVVESELRAARQAAERIAAPPAFAEGLRAVEDRLAAYARQLATRSAGM